MSEELKKYLIEQCRDWMLPEEIKALRRISLTKNSDISYRKNSLASKKLESLFGYNDEKTNDLVALGKLELEITIANRILDNHDEEVLNNCTNCGKLARTPKAKQCRYCGNKWFNNGFE